jgi:hypothetical protein
MAKALTLPADMLDAPVEQPRAAQPPKAERAAKAPKPVKPPQVPLQIRIGAEDAKAIKHAALEADQTISEFMLACFHARMKK